MIQMPQERSACLKASPNPDREQDASWGLFQGKAAHVTEEAYMSVNDTKAPGIGNGEAGTRSTWWKRASRRTRICFISFLKFSMPRFRLDAKKATKIRDLSKKGWSVSRIASQYKVGLNTVRDVLKKRTWK